MKRRYNIAALAIIVSLAFTNVAMAATSPAYPEVPVSDRTSNLAENQNFVDWYKQRKNDSVQGKLIFYNIYGLPMINSRLAGGAATNESGIFVWNNKIIDGIELNINGISLPIGEFGWKQDPNHPVNENGISNWYLGYEGFPSPNSSWEWLSDQDNVFSTSKAYCFNECGYLYVNTVTPDGFIVNERGQMITEDGTLVEHEYDALTHDAMHSAFIGAPIGFMRQKYFTVCIWPECGGKCFTGANEKEFSDRASQYTEEENRQRIIESRNVK